MSDFKFIHASDIHLDSPLRGLSRYEGVPGDRVRLATREALDNLVNAAIEEAVSFVVIAGDLYDGDWDHFGTGLFFCAAMRRLGDAGIEVYLLYGNHDADSVLTKKLPLPSNVHVFGHRKVQQFKNDSTGTILHGRSYKDRDPGENLSLSYPPAVVGAFNIGVLHTALTGGRPPHAPYSPCTPAELATKGYDYWALGHVHDFEVVETDPYIVFSGNLQGRNIRECGKKGAVLVTVEDGQVSDLKHLELDAVRWISVEIDVSGSNNDTKLQSMIRSALQVATKDVSAKKPLMARVTLSGQTLNHGSLLSRRETVREDVRAIAVSISDSLWIEKVKIETTASPGAQPSAAAIQSDDIVTLLDEGAKEASLKESLAEVFAGLANKMPADLGEETGALASIRRADFEKILSEAAESLRARLQKQEA